MHSIRVSTEKLLIFFSMYTVESAEFARGNFRELPFSAIYGEVINSRIAVVREMIDQWPMWVSARCPRCESRRGVTAGELGHTPAPGGCLPSREGVNSTLAFVLGVGLLVRSILVL